MFEIRALCCVILKGRNVNFECNTQVPTLSRIMIELLDVHVLHVVVDFLLVARRICMVLAKLVNSVYRINIVLVFHRAGFTVCDDCQCLHTVLLPVLYFFLSVLTVIHMCVVMCCLCSFVCHFTVNVPFSSKSFIEVIHQEGYQRRVIHLAKLAKYWIFTLF